MIPLLNDIVNVDGNDIIQVEIDGGGGGGGGRWYCLVFVWCMSIVRRHRCWTDVVALRLRDVRWY